MQDVNISDDLRQLAHDQVKQREYSLYDINEYHFRMTKLEANSPLAATSNNIVVTSVVDATGNVIDYYGVLQKKYLVHIWWCKGAVSSVFFTMIGLIQSLALESMISVW
jgi:hypothetical protein